MTSWLPKRRTPAQPMPAGGPAEPATLHAPSGADAWTPDGEIRVRGQTAGLPADIGLDRNGHARAAYGQGVSPSAHEPARVTPALPRCIMCLDDGRPCSWCQESEYR